MAFSSGPFSEPFSCLDTVTPPAWTGPVQPSHPLLQPSASHETAEDVFNALDAFLESEFPELDSSMCESPTGSSSSFDDSPVHKLLPRHQPAIIISSLENTAPPSSISEAVAALAPAAAVATAAAKAAAEARNAAQQSPPHAVSPRTSTFSAATGLTPPITRAGSSSSTISNDSTAIPRWKVYHMQQRQELLAPKTSQQEVQQQQPAQIQATAVHSPTAAVFGGSCSLVPVAAGAGFPCGSIAAISVPVSMTAAPMMSERMLLLNWQQQQVQVQLQLQQQQQCAVTGKRAWASETEAAGPRPAKRSRVSAAGNIAAQHLYGLASESGEQLQGLPPYQVSLQQQIQHNQCTQQQQVDGWYQQQQLQALHQGLHLRLQLQQQQQHQFALEQSRQRLQCA